MAARSSAAHLGAPEAPRAPWPNAGPHAADYTRLAELHGELAGIYARLAEESGKSLEVSGARALMSDVVDIQPVAERLLSVRDVADRLGVQPRTVRRWRETGALPAGISISGITRWRPAAVEAWLASREGVR